MMAAVMLEISERLEKRIDNDDLLPDLVDMIHEELDTFKMEAEANQLALSPEEVFELQKEFDDFVKQIKEPEEQVKEIATYAVSTSENKGKLQ